MIKITKRIDVNEFRAIEYYVVVVNGKQNRVDLDNISFEELEWNYPTLVKDGKPIPNNIEIANYEYANEKDFIDAGWFDSLERQVLKML